MLNYSMYNDSKAIQHNWMDQINRAKSYLASQNTANLSADIDPRLISERAKMLPRYQPSRYHGNQPGYHQQEDLVDYVRNLEAKLDMVIEKMNSEPRGLHNSREFSREPLFNSRELTRNSFSRLSRSIDEEVGRRLLGYQLITPDNPEPQQKWAEKIPEIEKMREIPAYVSARELIERRVAEEGKPLPRFDAGKILGGKAPKLVFDNKTSNIHVYNDY